MPQANGKENAHMEEEKKTAPLDQESSNSELEGSRLPLKGQNGAKTRFSGNGIRKVAHNLDGKKVIWVDIPEAPRNRKPVYLNGNLAESYVRGSDGDYKATQSEIKAMLIDNGEDQYDLLPNALSYGMEVIEKESLSAFRKEMELRRGPTMYQTLSDEEFLKKVACLRDVGSREILTNAAVLMFSSAPIIESLFGSYSLDYREADSFKDKWRNRIQSDDLSWSGNMYDFYCRCYDRAASFLPSPYHFENGGDIGKKSVADALKEAFANALSNYAYFLGGGVSVLNTGRTLIFRNAGKMKVGLRQALLGGMSNPRNAGILTLFRHVGVADKAGTGLPKIFSAWKESHLPDPVLNEESNPDFTELQLSLVPLPGGKLPGGVQREKLVSFLSSKGSEGASTPEVMERFSISRSTASKLLNALADEGTIQSNGKEGLGKRYKA